MDWREIDTVLLDLDGTLLDLKFDNYFWSEHVPERFASHHELPLDEARKQVMDRISAEYGTLRWYCTDFWSQELGLDIIALKHEIRDRIGPRPGAREFLERLRDAGRSVHLVTNAHPDTLELKLEQVPIGEYFHGLWSSHSFGHAKESIEFWAALQRELPFQAERCLFIDDNESVLDAAAAYGIRYVRTILHPDSGQPERNQTRHPGIGHFGELTPANP